MQFQPQAMYCGKTTVNSEREKNMDGSETSTQEEKKSALKIHALKRLSSTISISFSSPFFSTVENLHEKLLKRSSSGKARERERELKMK